MRIALLSYKYPPETGFGGVGTYAYYQARALAKLGHHVHVFAGSTSNGVHHSEHDGVKVTRIKREGWLHRWLAPARQKKAWWFQSRIETAFAGYEALCHELQKHAFDFVEAPECGADSLVTSTLLPIPTAIKFHSPARLIQHVYDTPRLDRELTAFAEQLAINQAKVWTSCSRFLADEVALKMNVTGAIHVVPNGIDVAMFDRDEGIDVRARFGLPSDKVIVFFANRMEERKGIHLVKDMALHCLQKYPNVAFAFAGRDLFGYMERKILPSIRDHQLQSRFFYLGQLDQASVRAVLKQSDIFLIPSLWENCPYSCIEAMTAGRAIVASDCGGLPEMIQDHQNGLLARSGDSASFIAALAEVIEDASLRQRLGAGARRDVEQRYTDTGIAARSVAIYQGWLDGNHVAAETLAEQKVRLAAAPRATTAGEVAELQLRVAKLTARLAVAERAAAPQLGEVERQRLGTVLLRDLGLATARRRLKKWYRKARNLKNRRALSIGAGRGNRVVLASTWDFPFPTHSFVYQEMLGFQAAGLDVRIFYGERRPADGLAARFLPLLKAGVPVETVLEIHRADLDHLDRTRPGRVDAFLQQVAAATGGSIANLRQNPLVLRAATFARMAELAGARYLQSWFFYDESFMAMFAAAVLGIPRGISCHVDHMLADHPFKLVPLQLRTADLVLAISERTRDELLRLGGADCAAKILVKRIGIDGEALRPLRRRPVTGPFNLLSVCRLEPKKGLLVLVEACDLLRRRGRPVRVRLVGGEDHGHPESAAFAVRLRQRIAELHLHDTVLLLGPVAQDQIPGVLATATAFVAPYVELVTGDKDGIPTAMIEAMAAGLPVIATRVGAIPEAVTDGEEGLLVPQHDAVALADAIDRLAGDASLCARLGAAAAQRFDREFDCRVTDQEMHARIRQLLASSGVCRT